MKKTVMNRKYFLLCTVLILLLSCMEKKNNAVSEQPSEIEQDNSEDTSQNILNTPLSAEEVMELIYENDRYIKKITNEIVFIEKANFGIPGGDNWIVRTSARGISVYVVNGNKIEKHYKVFTMDYNLTKHTNFDIMRDISGTHIPGGTSSIGDFNDDGIDEIFQYAFGGMGNFVLIWFYNSETDDFRTYCSISFMLIDPDNGPAPAEFMTYQDMFGFKVCVYETSVAGGPDYVYEPHPNNGRWFFYTWDGEQREYVRYGEVVE